jgi:hypothetical protein
VGLSFPNLKDLEQKVFIPTIKFDQKNIVLIPNFSNLGKDREGMKNFLHENCF